jgi:selenocysteine lyase/cysteine desulfurase
MTTDAAQEMVQTDAAYADFIARYPDYLKTSALDQLRAADYHRLDDAGQVYLDYTGGSLYGESQLNEHLNLLRSGIFGNPHSANPTSTAITNLLERTRHSVLRYLNASPDEYTLVFTANASAALKLVGESFPFAPKSRLLLAFDNHNSVNGIREFARAKGAEIAYAPLDAPCLRLNVERLDALLGEADPACENLFAFPAQSNFSGVKHPLELVAQAQSRGWRVLLDSAAFAPTNRLDLTAIQPDFVVLSFYKIFGYPTGVGALLMRKSAAARLHRPWFAGGTVNFVSVQALAHVLSPGEAAFEDGTLNYLSIPAVEIGLRHIEAIGMDLITERVRCLTGWMLEQLLALRHTNGRPMVRIYGPTTTKARGGTISLNLYDHHESLLDYRRVEELAGNEGISLRTGCFCNPGAGESAEGLTADDMRAALTLGSDVNLASFMRLMQDRGHKSAGAIRVSIGLVSNFADVSRFVNFIAGFRDQTRLSLGEVTFDIESCRVIRDGS